jgi:CDP-glycerol glycerophosphotransferase
MGDKVAKLVSVVVPIHNVAPYLAECLDSVRRQTHRELEVIMVDDGSTDNSAEIAEQFAATDSRFRLMRQENGGLSAARNAGVPHANGDYLAFLDSDDLLPCFAYEVMVQAAETSGTAFVTGSAHRLSTRGHYLGYPHDQVFLQTNLRTHVSADHGLLRDRTIWNKVFRKSFWDDHGFVFPPGRLFEDMPVSIPAHALAERVSVLDLPIYYWRVREGADRSITQSDTDVCNMVDRFYSVNLVRQALAAAGHHKLRQAYEEMALWDELSHYLKFIPDASEAYRRTFVDLAKKYLDDLSPDVIKRMPNWRQHWRQHWLAIRAGRMDELIELINDEHRPASFSADPQRSGKLVSGLREVQWRDGKLHLSGYAFVEGCGASRPWSSARLLWLREPKTRRTVLLPSATRRSAEAEARSRDPHRSYAWSGFSVAIDPASLRTGGAWRSGTWTAAVAATGGVRLRRDGLRLGADAEPIRLTSHEVAPGVRVTPGFTGGVFRIRVDTSAASTAWATDIRREGDELAIAGLASGALGESPELLLSRVHGVASRVIAIDVAPGDDGLTTFSGRIPLAYFAVDDHTDRHACGLDAQRVMIQLRWAGGEPMHLMMAADATHVRTRYGTDEVFTHRSDSGCLWVCSRPAGPVAITADWQPDGSLLLAGDWHRPIDGEILLRMRGPRRDIGFPVRAADTGWEATIRPDAAPTLAGEVSLQPGLWDINVRYERDAGAITTDLYFAEELRAQLPLLGEADGVRCQLEPISGERAALRVREELRADERGARAQERLRTRFHAAKQQPALRDVVLFDAFAGRRIADSPRAILAELAGRQSAPIALWTRQPGQPVPTRANGIRIHSAQWYEALATSRYIVTNDHLPRWFRRREGQMVLQADRGWPIVRFGAGARSHPLGKRLIDQLEADAANWNALISPSRFATPILRRELLFEGEVLETGRPANDVFRNADREDLRATVLRRLSLPADAVTILYAPTHRPADLRHPGRSNPACLLDLPVLRDALPADHVLLVRRHPQLVDDVVCPGPGVYDVSDYPDVGELLVAADILITDYSSVMADFANTGRPILLYVPDLEQFQDAPGFSIDFAAEAPGPLLRGAGEVAEAIRDVETVAASHRASYQAFISRFCDLDDGRATGRVVDLLLSDDH